MPPIQRPDISRDIAKRFGVVGFSGPESISPEIVPVYVVERVEPTATDRMAAGAFEEAAVAGDFGHIELFNPVGSGVIVLIDRIEGSTAVAGSFTVRVRNASVAANQGVAQWRDRRLPGRPVGQLGSLGAVAIATGDEIWIAAKAASTTLSLIEDFPVVILPPGNGCFFAFETANTALLGTFWWRERSFSQFTD